MEKIIEVGSTLYHSYITKDKSRFIRKVKIKDIKYVSIDCCKNDKDEIFVVYDESEEAEPMRFYREQIGAFLFLCKEDIAEKEKRDLEEILEKERIKEELELKRLRKLEEKKATEEHFEKVSDYFKSKKIRHLIHFTNIDNVESIMQHGIIPRTTRIQKGIKFKWSDEKRSDEHPERSCFSVGWPNELMLYKKQEYEHMEFAILLIDISVIDKIDSENIYYSAINAATSGASFSKGLYGAESLFKEDKERRREIFHLPDDFPTNIQAEILIRDIIPPEYIREIHVNKHEYLSVFDSLTSTVELKLDGKYFTYPSGRYDWYESCKKYAIW